MPQRRQNDPAGLSDHPNVVTDPMRQAELVAEFRRGWNYLIDSYRYEQRLALDKQSYNRSLARLKKAVGRRRADEAPMSRLSPWLALAINMEAGELAGLAPDNRFVFAPFWAHHNGLPGYDDWSVRLDKSRTAIGYALRQQDTATILSILFDRLYVLRNQLVHGGATWASDVNRAQVRDGAALLGCLLPIFIDLMMDAPQVEWPMPHYPVV